MPKRASGLEGFAQRAGWWLPFVLAAIAAATFGGLVGSTRAATGPQQQATAAKDQQGAQNNAMPGATGAQNGYVGADTCKTCHEDQYDSWANSRHYKTTNDTRGGQAKQGCEACHGPGAEHVANPADTSKLFNFKTASSKEINDKCMTCHATSTTQLHAINSLHAKNNVACTACHSPHHSTTPEFLLVKTQPDLCYTCHLQQKPQFAMPTHHRVNEGLIRCTDCHNPHGSERPTQLRASAAQDVVCFNCHQDKRGPFVYEHEAVKVEGCTACHTPHGSPNVHLLKVSNVNILCLSCHTTTTFSSAPGTPSFHNQAAQYQACTMCHTSIHGSYSSSFFFK